MARLMLSLLVLWICVTLSVCHAHQNKQPHHIELISRKGGEVFYCGGSLIQETLILTLSHCWREGWTIHAAADKGVIQINDKPVIYADNEKNSLIILRLPQPITQTKPVTLHDCKPGPKLGAKGQVMVHGGSHHDAHSHEAHESEADITVADCKNTEHHVQHNNTHHHHDHDDHDHHDHHDHDHDDHDKKWFCATSGANVCQDDFGGGVVFNNKLLGVIPSIAGDCTKALELINVCGYKTWIDEQLKPVMAVLKDNLLEKFINPHV